MKIRLKQTCIILSNKNSTKFLAIKMYNYSNNLILMNEVEAKLLLLKSSKSNIITN